MLCGGGGLGGWDLGNFLESSPDQMSIECVPCMAIRQLGGLIFP